ncbi:MAG: hypothetical protein ACLFRD_01985 [Nitriliruptoraceae bacterium]
MPPRQCPECGRFLKNALVERLTDGPEPCPGCGTTLRAAMFLDAEPSVGAEGDGSPASVRPPDLEPGSVRESARDPLAGWDPDASAAEVASWRDDRPPFPVDLTVVVGAALLGAGVGALSDERQRGRGAALGLLVGVSTAAVVRRIWRLSP